LEPVAHESEGQVETIGQRLRRLRHERGLSQRELSSPGVSYAYISRIEAGARRPSVKALRMLAKKLGVTADYLETGSEIRDTDERELRIADAELELRLTDDPAEAEKKLERLRDEAAAAGDVVAASRANIALGFAAAAAGRNADAIEHLETGLQLSPVSPSARPDVFATLGRAYAATSRSDKAVEVFERSLQEVEQEAPEDASAQIRFTTYLSFALTDMGDLERAQSVLDAALENADALTDAYSRVRLYWGLARLNDLQGRPAAALDHVRRAIALLDVTDDTLHLARAHLLCGSILMTQGRAEEAGRNFDIAEQLFGPNPEPIDVGNLYTDQARRAVHLGDGEEAVRRARAALAAVGDEYPHEHGNALWALAEGLALTGEADAADDAFRKATSLLGEQGHRRDYVEAYRAWGKFLRRSGREDQALEVLERAADLASEPVASDTRAPR
jgi:tetratricopeptide (TPR) repeat protein